MVRRRVYGFTRVKILWGIGPKKLGGRKGDGGLGGTAREQRFHAKKTKLLMLAG